MIARAALAAAALTLVGAAGADAAIRPIQAYDRPAPGVPLWMPQGALVAQPGDTVRWTFTQPGNANAASHDLVLTRPGQAETKVAASFSVASFDELVSEGDYAFYCSVHPDSMTGTVVVRAGEATPVVEPGRPWDAPPVVVDPGPPPAVNPTTPPTLFEEGDNTAPTMGAPKVTRSGRSARVRVKVSEAGTLHLRLLRGTKTVANRTVKVKAGTRTGTITLPKRRGTYRLAIWTEDAVGLASKWRYKTLRV